MPSDTAKQARLMAADYGRAKSGKKARTGMTIEELREWVKADQRKRGRKPHTSAPSSHSTCCPPG